MSPRPPGDRPRSAEVLNLMCARFEAALADGEVDELLRAHEQSCERCSDFSRELAAAQAWIAQATGPSDALPEGFLDTVLLRADALDGRLGAGQTLSRSRRPGFGALAVAGLAAAAVLMAFWAGGAREQLRQADERAQVRVEAPNATPTSPAVVAQAVPSETMTPSPTPAPKTAQQRRVEPTVPAASPVPEPVVDLGAEIQGMLRDQVTTHEACPKHTSAAVWVTATVLSDGSLTNRSVMSAGSATDAHRCVSRALDQLLLPPGSPTTTVTFELSW